MNRLGILKLFKPWMDLYIYSHLFTSLYSAVHMHQIFLKKFPYHFHRKQSLKTSNAETQHSILPQLKQLYRTQQNLSKNELCCRLSHAKISNVISENEKDGSLSTFYSFQLFHMATLVLQHSQFWGKFMNSCKILHKFLMIWKAFHNECLSGANAQGSLPEILSDFSSN